MLTILGKLVDNLPSQVPHFIGKPFVIDCSNKNDTFLSLVFGSKFSIASTAEATHQVLPDLHPGNNRARGVAHTSCIDSQNMVWLRTRSRYIRHSSTKGPSRFKRRVPTL